MNSTASSALNAMALVSLEDVVKKKVPDITDSDAAKLCKIIGQLFTALFSSSLWDMFNLRLYDKLNYMHALWLVLSNDLLGDRHKYYVTMNNILPSYHV